jgi:hypothetical protein
VGWAGRADWHLQARWALSTRRARALDGEGCVGPRPAERMGRRREWLAAASRLPGAASAANPAPAIAHGNGEAARGIGAALPVHAHRHRQRAVGGAIRAEGVDTCGAMCAVGGSAVHIVCRFCCCASALHASARPWRPPSIAAACSLPPLPIPNVNVSPVPVRMVPDGLESVPAWQHAPRRQGRCGLLGRCFHRQRRSINPRTSRPCAATCVKPRARSR